MALTWSKRRTVLLDFLDRAGWTAGQVFFATLLAGGEHRGHAYIQNLRRGHYELGVDAPPALRVAAAFTELTHAI